MDSDNALRDGRSMPGGDSDQSYVKQQLDSIYQQMACITMQLLMYCWGQC